jgi:hypothetical protein
MSITSGGETYSEATPDSQCQEPLHLKRGLLTMRATTAERSPPLRGDEHAGLREWLPILLGPHDEGVNQVFSLPDGLLIGVAMRMSAWELRD